MSITNNLQLTKKHLYAGLSTLTLVGILGFAGINAKASPRFLSGNEVAREALESGDYEAFKSAVQVEDEQGRISRRFSEFDEAQFLRLQERFLQEEMIQDAIEAGDYVAYREVIEGLEQEGVETRTGRRHGLKMVAETEEEFEQLVSIYQEKQDFQEELQAAVVADDQAQFEQLLEERLTGLQERIDARREARRERPEPTQEQLNELFAQAQAAVEDGEEIRLRPNYR